MPNKRLTITNLPANAIRDFMLDADQGATNLRFVDRPSRCVYVLNCNGAVGGAEYEIYASSSTLGARRVVERSGVPVGGTAGLYPPLNEQAETFDIAAGEIIEFRIRETGGVATTDLNLNISIEPYV